MDFLKFVYRCTKSPPPSPKVEDHGVLHEVLDNELLLDLIFKNLMTNDLKSCRLVCGKWNKLAVKRIRKRYFMNAKMLRLKNDVEIRDFISTFRHDPNSLVHNSVGFWLKSSKLHYSTRLLKLFFETFRQKFNTLSLDFSFNSSEELETILQTQNESLTELSICSRERSISNELKSSSTFQLPNLNYLCLSEQFENAENVNEGEEEVEDNDDQHINQLHLLESLLPRIPNKNSLKLCLREWGMIRETTDFLEKFGHIRNLKMIDIYTIGRGELKKLADSGVRLEFLILEPSPCYRDAEIDEVILTEEVFTFLCNQAISLEMLSWGNPNFKFPPVMPGLKNLKLSLEHNLLGPPLGVAGQQQQVPIIYEKFFPNLEELYLCYDDQYVQHPDFPDNFRSQFLSPQTPCTSLKKLIVRYANLNAATMNMISEIFPTIRSLGIAPYRNSMTGLQPEVQFYSAIWNSNFAHTLEELGIELDDDEDRNYRRRDEHELDHLFSGVPVADIVSAVTSMSYQGDYDSPAYDNIFKLKNLKSLKVYAASRGTEESTERSFTDFSAFCIFGKMEKVTYLHLDKVIRTKFSYLGRECLRNKYYDSPGNPEAIRKDRIIEAVSMTDFEDYTTWKATYNLRSQGLEPENDIESEGEDNDFYDLEYADVREDDVTTDEFKCSSDEYNHGYLHSNKVRNGLDEYSDSDGNGDEFSDAESSSPDPDPELLVVDPKSIDPDESDSDSEPGDFEPEFSDSAIESDPEYV